MIDAIKGNKRSYRVNRESEKTEGRKIEHILICLSKNVIPKEKTTGLEDIEFVHVSLPEINKSDIDTSIKLLGHELAAPIVIAAMTGGHPKAAKINATLAEAAQELNIAMGVGSQRAALEDPSLEYTYSIAREKAPDILLIGNIGAPQILEKNRIENIRKIVEMIDADAVAIHLNALQEAIQPEGEAVFKGVLSAIKDIVEKIEVPIIAKETGAGFAREEARSLERIGVKAIDVGGTGGTSWAAVETYRAEKLGMHFAAGIGKTFWDWGIPTTISTIETSFFTNNIEIIATGGVRTGLDAAKLISLGANAVGISLPLLKPAYEGKVEKIIQILQKVIEELKITMFLVGASKITDLKKADIIIMGRTAEWLKARGFDITIFANRRKQQKEKIK